MTIIKRICPELSDILAIQIECKYCHSTISYPPSSWKPAILKCLNCPATLVRGLTPNQQSEELRALCALAEGLQDLLKIKDAEFRLRLEFAQRD